VVDITRLLAALDRDEPDAAGTLLAQVYAELQALARAKMARERPGHTLQPTALVHEAWLKLGDQRFENRAHFFGAAAEAMRRILVDRARRKLALRHGGGQERVDVDEIEIAAPVEESDQLIAVHEALERFAVESPAKAELVKLRFFGGLSLEEAGAILGLPERTAQRHWAYAKAWLFDAVRDGRKNCGGFG
jgi:RNA polymerase sigma factor (TIGR02999 family)